MKAIKLSSSIINFSILAIAGVILVQSIVTQQENHRLRASLDSSTGMAIPPNRVLRNVAAASSDGELKTISMPAGPSEKLLIMTFSPSCEYCQASQAAWKSLAKELRARPGWRVLWVSRDPIKNTVGYCKEQQIPLEEAVADPTYRTYMQLALKLVPNTVVVGDGGRVEKVWSGRVDDKQWGEMAAYFNLQQKRLPTPTPDKDLSAAAKK